MVSLRMELTVLGDSYFWLQSKTLILPKHSCTRTCWKRRSKAGSYASNTEATAVESQHWGEFPWKICTTSEPFQCIAGTHPKWSRPRSAILLLPAAALEDSPRPLPHFKRAVLRKWRHDCVCSWYLPLSTSTMPTSSALPNSCVHSLWWKGTPPLAPAPTIVWISSGNQVYQD